MRIMAETETLADALTTAFRNLGVTDFMFTTGTATAADNDWVQGNWQAFMDRETERAKQNNSSGTVLQDWQNRWA